MAVAAFRADVARAGAMQEVAALVDELSRSSPVFREMWQDNNVSDNAHAVKDLRHPVLGTLSFECSTFGVDGRQDLTMLVFVPASTEIAEGITSLLSANASASHTSVSDGSSPSPSTTPNLPLGH